MFVQGGGGGGWGGGGGGLGRKGEGGRRDDFLPVSFLEGLKTKKGNQQGACIKSTIRNSYWGGRGENRVERVAGSMRTEEGGGKGGLIKELFITAGETFG